MSQKNEDGLSRGAFNELKKLVRNEYGNAISDGEIDELGIRLLKLFSLLYPKNTERQTDVPLLSTFQDLNR